MIPMGMCSCSHRPPPSIPAHNVSGNAGQTRATSNRPLSPPSVPSPPPTPTPDRPPKKTTGPKTPQPHPSAPLCAWVVAQPAYCLAWAPQHVLYAQTDDTAALARHPRHKENNVLPRSFINALSSRRQLAVNKGASAKSAATERCRHPQQRGPQSSAHWHSHLTSASLRSRA